MSAEPVITVPVRDPGLMRSPRFAPLFWCQFLGAFGDNFIKNVLVILIVFRLGAEHSALLVTLAGAIFILPFFLFSSLGGEIADRHDKASVAQWLKFVEMSFAVVGAVGFALQSLPILFAALFLYGVNSALFGPIKYGILPDHLPRHELPTANALIEAATFLAILTGTIAGGIAAAIGQPELISAALVGIALCCWLASLLIPGTGPRDPHLVIDWNIARSTLALMRDLRATPDLWTGALIVSWFWALGVVVLAILPIMIRDVVGGNESVVTAFLAIFSVAIGIGSALAAMLARGRIVLWPVPVGALIMAGFCGDLIIATAGAVQALPAIGVDVFFGREPGLRLAIDMAGLAIGGGLFVVPVFAALQAWSAPARRARVIAGVNVLNAAAMVMASGLLGALQAAGTSVPALFALLCVANAMVAAAAWQALRRRSPAPA